MDQIIVGSVNPICECYSVLEPFLSLRASLGIGEVVIWVELGRMIGAIDWPGLIKDMAVVFFPTYIAAKYGTKQGSKLSVKMEKDRILNAEISRKREALTQLIFHFGSSTIMSESLSRASPSKWSTLPENEREICDNERRDRVRILRDAASAAYINVGPDDAVRREIQEIYTACTLFLKGMNRSKDPKSSTQLLAELRADVSEPLARIQKTDNLLPQFVPGQLADLAPSNEMQDPKNTSDAEPSNDTTDWDHEHWDDSTGQQVGNTSA